MNNTGKAFTLIEMLIAISLGTAICYTSFAAIRMASQSMTAISSLSQQNRIMREGVSAAFHELDFWDDIDDHDPATGNLSADGQPFSAFDWDSAGLQTDFAQHRSETLYRGCGATHDAKRYGNYGLLSNIAHVDPDRSHYGKFLKGIADHLGYYALMDYAPANTIYSYYDDAGDTPAEFRDSGHGYGHFYYGPCTDIGPRDIHRMTEAGGLALSPNNPEVAHHGFTFWDNWGSGDWGATAGWNWMDMVEASRVTPQVMPVKPEHWPSLQVDVRHFCACYRTWNTATIHVTDPVSGKAFKLFMSVTATTLRGARDQRGLDRGLRP